MSEPPSWDLSDLARSPSEAMARARALGAMAQELADAGPPKNAAQLAGLLERAAELQEEIVALSSYPELLARAGADDGEVGILLGELMPYLQSASEPLSQLFGWWLELDEEKALPYLLADELAGQAPLLRRLREEDEEELPAAEEAQAQYADTLGRVEDDLGQSLLELIEITQQYLPSVERHAARARLHQALSPRLAEIAPCFQAVAAAGPGAFQFVCRGAGLKSEAVENMLAQVESRREVVQRWALAKGRHLGQKSCDSRDWLTPWAETKSYPWSLAVHASARALEPIDPWQDLPPLLQNHVDARPRAGKERGSICVEIGRRTRPYVLMSYSGAFLSAVALGHELGHALYGILATRSSRGFSLPLAPVWAELPAAVAERLMAEELLALTPVEDRSEAKSLWVEHLLLGVFAHSMLTRFEHRLYSLSEQGLDADAITAEWLAANESLYEGAVNLSPDYRSEWALMGHLVNAPFYEYTYPFSQLLAVLLVPRIRERGADDYLALLERMSQDGDGLRALNEAGIDVHSPSTWREALELLAAEVNEALVSRGEPSAREL